MYAREEIELKISERLRVLPAAALQCLAEEIALIRDPDRYRNLFGQGRNAEAQTTKGWPDAYVVSADGTIDGVEATRDKTHWQKHLEADLAKAQRPNQPRLNGYFFVAGYPDHDPTKTEIGSWIQRFHALDIPEDRIDILVGRALVRELLDPKYARSLQSILGISRTPEYFELIRSRSTAGRRQWAFEPTSEEYLSGQVHRHPLVEDVQGYLRRLGCALVRGRGAAGKSVFARLIAAEYELRALPSYYLDLATLNAPVEQVRGTLVDAMVEFGGARVLFVVDNVHLAEDFVASLFLEWQELMRPAGTQLLLVGREVKRRVESSLRSSSIPSVVLRARTGSLRGVFMRLASRELASSTTVPEPPMNVLRSWLRTFGGDPDAEETSADLIAFSAAVRNKIKQLLQHDWDLSVDDPRHDVRNRYLNTISNDERQNLLRLASLPDDAPLHASTLAAPYAPFDECVAQGLVFETEHGIEKSIRYSLVHSALGRILRAAADPKVDRESEYRAIANRSSVAGLHLVVRLVDEFDFAIARTLLQIIREDANWLDEIRDVVFLPSALRAAEKAGVDLIPFNIDGCTQFRKRLLKVALRSQLGSLTPFLQYLMSMRGCESSIFKSLVSDINDDPAELVRRARKEANPQELAFFLKFTRSRQNGLQPLHKAVVAAISEHPDTIVARAVHGTPIPGLAALLRQARNPENGLLVFYWKLTEAMNSDPDELIRRALEQTSLTYLADFLRFTCAKKNGLTHFHQTLISRINESPAAFIRRAMQFATLQYLVVFLKCLRYRPIGLSESLESIIGAINDQKVELVRRAREHLSLDHLAYFLRYSQSTKSGLSPLYEALVASLNGSPESIIEYAVHQAPLEHLAAFLAYAGSDENDLMPLYSQLIKNLVKKSSAIASRSYACDLGHLVTFLNFVEFEDSYSSEVNPRFAKEILGHLDVDRWNRTRNEERTTHPTSVAAAARLLSKLERPELCRIPAESLIRSADRPLWHATGVGIVHLSHVVRCGVNIEGQSLEKFLNEVVTVEWLRRNYKGAHVGGLAGALFALAHFLPPEHHSRFVTTDLLKRLEAELASAEHSDIDNWVVLISLMGAAAIVGADSSSPCDNWPEDWVIPWLLERRRAGIDGFGPNQMQFWIGLREMAQSYRNNISVPDLDGEAALRFWRSAETPTAFAAACKYSMSMWLERCQMRGWVLVRSEKSIREEVVGEVLPSN